jgi:hypothetical protein
LENCVLNFEIRCNIFFIEEIFVSTIVEPGLKRDFASAIVEPGVLLVGKFNFLLDFAAGRPGTLVHRNNVIPSRTD